MADIPKYLNGYPLNGTNKNYRYFMASLAPLTQKIYTKSGKEQLEIAIIVNFIKP
ncbi:hypothetical protein ACU8KH_04550 [Lachancea thermotolerans]